MKNLLVTLVLIHLTLSLPWITKEEFEIRKALSRTTSTTTTTTTTTTAPPKLIENSIGLRTSFDRSSRCMSSQQCVLLSRCMNECNSVRGGLLQTDIKFKQHLQDVFCGLSSSQSVMVCCSKNFVSSKPHCPYLDEEYTEKSTCGRRFSTVSQITGGSKTEPGDWPWMARLLYNFPNETSKSVTNCGGTLISRRHVVTAGHCITEDVKPIAVALGDSDVTTDYDCLDVKSGYGCRTTGAACAAAEECAPKHIEVKIKDFIIHHKYKYENRRKFLLNFDVAMIVLEEPVTFSDFIQPVCLPNPKEQSQGPLTETGWGNTVASPGRKQSALILQELDVNEVPLDECRRKWKPKLKEDLLTSHMCASTGIPGSTSCIGDSGGPLVRNSDFQKQIWELAGVVSFGTKTCGNVDYPLAFTRVEGEVNLWLREIVGRELPGHS